MLLRIIILWVLGGLMIVPYSIYNLLYCAQPDQYAFLIVVPLFWIFGFWGVVGPVVAAYRIHQLMRALDQVQNKKELQEAYERNEGKAVLVDLISSETRLPKFIARMIYGRIEKILKENSLADAASGQPADRC